MGNALGSSHGRLQGDSLTEAYEPGDEGLDPPLGALAPLEVVGAWIAVELACGEHVPGGGEDRVANANEAVAL
jgi:hypothetical protein